MALAEQELPPVKYPHIWVDGYGVACLVGSRAKVYQIAVDHVHNRLTPEQIHDQYPHLPLAQIHSALAFYYDHRQEIDADIERRKRDVDQMQVEAEDQFTRAASGAPPAARHDN